jgi:proline iminopeptidase
MLFDLIDPFRTGLLPTDDGAQIYWEASGNPNGVPALFLHGGPGGGLKGGYRRRFDPDKHLIVSFDQRGCGRSLPLAADALELLPSNTTPTLINDIERLRKHLAIERWLVSGISWGTALGLAYAEAFAARVSSLVLCAIHIPNRKTVTWVTEEMRRVFPEQWDRFDEAVKHYPGDTIIERYHVAITQSDPRGRERAALAWCEWENAHVSLVERGVASIDARDLKFALNFATMVIHYWKHFGFLKPGFPDMGRISHIPCTLIHGRLDVSSPIEAAWDLHRSWPLSRLVVVEDEGHGGDKMMNEMARAISA